MNEINNLIYRFFLIISPFHLRFLFTQSFFIFPTFSRLPDNFITSFFIYLACLLVSFVPMQALRLIYSPPLACSTNEVLRKITFLHGSLTWLPPLLTRRTGNVVDPRQHGAEIFAWVMTRPERGWIILRLYLRFFFSFLTQTDVYCIGTVVILKSSVIKKKKSGSYRYICRQRWIYLFVVNDIFKRVSNWKKLISRL